jgi:hypothetical protein
MTEPYRLDGTPDLTSEGGTLRHAMDGGGSTSNLIRKVQVRVLPGAPKPQVSGIICRSWDDRRRTLVIPSGLNRAIIVPLERDM